MANSKTRLSTGEVCRILDSSAKAGVTELKFADLHVKFGRPAEIQVPEIKFPYPFMPQTAASAPVNDLTAEQHAKQNEDSIELDEIRLRQDQLDQAIVEDPMRYEELLRNGELIDDVDGTDDDDDL